MLACGHRKELGNLISVFVIIIKSCSEINNSSVVFESPPHAPNDRASSHIAKTSPQ